jgi:hypothetical protein
MSRAFVREDPDEVPPRYDLPPNEDPGFPRAAAWALLEGANQGDSLGAEAATGYRWGDPSLRPHVEEILRHARSRGDDRLEQLAERFLEAARGT